MRRSEEKEGTNYLKGGRKRSDELTKFGSNAWFRLPDQTKLDFFISFQNPNTYNICRTDGDVRSDFFPKVL